MLGAKERAILLVLSETEYCTSEMVKALGSVPKLPVPWSSSCGEKLLDNGADILARTRHGYMLQVTDRARYDALCNEGNNPERFIPSSSEERVYYLLVMLLSQADYIKLDDVSEETLCQQVHHLRGFAPGGKTSGRISSVHSAAAQLRHPHHGQGERYPQLHGPCAGQLQQYQRLGRRAPGTGRWPRPSPNILLDAARRYSTCIFPRSISAIGQHRVCHHAPYAAACLCPP